MRKHAWATVSYFNVDKKNAPEDLPELISLYATGHGLWDAMYLSDKISDSISQLLRV
jgi:hypothetical protein